MVFSLRPLRFLAGFARNLCSFLPGFSRVPAPFACSGQVGTCPTLHAAIISSNLMKFAWLVLAALPAIAQSPGEVRGSVVDARGGEALANVQIQLTGTAFRA